ncbi:Mrp/NBP35 family ATP-binding protein [Antarcticimicrobium sediminis]|uniref:Iron-sulfur cluster carrier protein n=1 Tax=Antarcticimicrobium sediminis TaxID=2546227 RepID=A0A4R5F0R7_9RHOB|nr:Mrp/NBP35 family ATP-binding protein [Antarcticimicrobium sediminis]TDE40862.1 iron-sulfur cluster carrier protein ApbC [Antarcticimicrobium sediminis]
MTTREAVLKELKTIIDPVSGQDIVSAGLVRALAVEGDTVRFVMEIDPKQAGPLEVVRTEAEALVAAMPGVAKASVLMTAHTEKAPPDLKAAAKPKPAGPQAVPGVKHIVAIASGKGGVGKSTVAANLAVALAAEGKNVGLLDADIYGPSQPRMMGVTKRPASPDGKTIIPLQAHGVTMMSIGLMMQEGQAVVWRGPMLMGALQQMMTQVAWGELDVLLIDLPPGTGDVQLTLSQKFQVDGAVIVCTPQDVALLDARKGIDMFRQLKTPVLGMIENMSTHVCSNCGHEEHLFGHGGVKAEAEKLGVPLLAEIPLHLDIRLSGDAGEPVAASKPDSAQAAAFRDVARKLIDQGVV